VEELWVDKTLMQKLFLPRLRTGMVRISLLLPPRTGLIPTISIPQTSQTISSLSLHGLKDLLSVMSGQGSF
jgi:hypothetical protein